MNDKSTALDMAQERMPEALAFAGPLDQARYVGHDEAATAGLHDAEVGHERGERVVRDLGTRSADTRDQ